MIVRVRAPGKVILCGEHAVVHGVEAIAAAIPLYTNAQIHLPPDHGEQALFLELVPLGLSLKWSLQTLAAIFDTSGARADPTSTRPCAPEWKLGFGKLVPENTPPGAQESVVVFLFLYTSILGVQPGVVRVDSEIPIGSGLGSSAAYSVCLSALLLAASRPPVGSKEDREWTSLSEADAYLVSRWAFEAEKILHGNPSGIDTTTCTIGNIVLFKKEQDEMKARQLSNLPPLRFLLTNTMVSRKTEKLVNGVKRTSLFQNIKSICQSVLEVLVSMNKTEVTTKAEKKLEELLAENQDLLRDMGVSHPCIEDICVITSKYGLESKLTGAGGGGCVLTFLPRATSSGLVEQVISELEERHFKCLRIELGCCEGVQIS